MMYMCCFIVQSQVDFYVYRVQLYIYLHTFAQTSTVVLLSEQHIHTQTHQHCFTRTRTKSPCMFRQNASNRQRRRNISKMKNLRHHRFLKAIALIISQLFFSFVHPLNVIFLLKMFLRFDRVLFYLQLMMLYSLYNDGLHHKI